MTLIMPGRDTDRGDKVPDVYAYGHDFDLDHTEQVEGKRPRSYSSSVLYSGPLGDYLLMLTCSNRIRPREERWKGRRSGDGAGKMGRLRGPGAIREEDCGPDWVWEQEEALEVCMRSICDIVARMFSLRLRR